MAFYRKLTPWSSNSPKLLFFYRYLNDSLQIRRSIRRRAKKGEMMRVKVTAFVVVAVASIALFAAMHRESRADAASGDCYAADQGPSTPTICQ